MPVDFDVMDEIAVVRLAHGKVNALDAELLRDIVAALEDVERTGRRAVVITGAGPAFSAGVDLHRVLDGGVEYAREFLPALSSALIRAFTMPVPVVAAVNGHAIAGGCILACAAERRLMSDGQGRIGASEVVVGVTFPAAALEILRYACGPHAEEVVLGGGLHDPERARSLGLVHEVVPADELLTRAVAVATALAAPRPAAYRHTKAALRAPVLARIEADAARDADVVRDWADGETVAILRAFVERSFGSRPGTRM
jgi:enoyl-CoA hydratase/carnithine racemase